MEILYYDLEIFSLSCVSSYFLNFKNSDFIMSVSPQGKVHFRVYLLKHSHLVMKLGKVIDKVINKTFMKI